MNPTEPPKSEEGDTHILGGGQTVPLPPPPNAAENGVVVYKAVVPDRLRIIMPDQSELIFDHLYPNLMIGRKTSNSRHVDIDMAQFDAGISGVSRVHAVLTPDTHHGLTIKDLKSTNGTFLNGDQLRPEIPYPVKSGDFLKFGNLKLQVIFIYNQDKPG